VDAGPGAGPEAAVTVVDGPARWSAIIGQFLQRHVEAAGAKGVVVGASGGLDSAVVVALAARALGPGRVRAWAMPAPDSQPEDALHAALACAAAGVEPRTVPIGPILAGFDAAFGEADARVRGNAKARARMMLLYAEAQRSGLLVCGTGNKSELLTGYFTKHGDGGADLQPIGDLYKAQVRELGAFLGVPAPILEKPPSAGLHPGQTDEQDLGLSYRDLDAILRQMELNLPLDAIARRTGLALELVQKVDGLVRATEHKRRPALVPKIGVRTVGVDWRRSVQWDG
jgi:NAD+ synthase